MGVGLSRWVQLALAEAGSGDQLAQVLGAAWVAVPQVAHPEAIAFVHREWLDMVVAPIDGVGRLAASPSSIVGDDARIYLADHLRRLGAVADVLDFLERLQGRPPAVLEALPRGFRLVLPARTCVVEIRGRRAVDRLRILDESASRDAIDAAARVAADLAGLTQRIGPLRPLDREAWLGIEGHVVLALLPSGQGFELLTPLAARERIDAHVQAAGSIAAIDRLVRLWLKRYQRRERADALGRSEVAWRLDGLGLWVEWLGDGAVMTRPVVEKATP